MTNNSKLDENIEAVENIRAWKYRIMLILQENDLDKRVKEQVKEPKEEEAKSKHNKHMIIPKRIIAESIKDNLIPQVSQGRIQNKCWMLYCVYLKEETLIGK